MKKVSELSDRELQEWQYHMMAKCEKHLKWISNYFTAVAFLGIMGIFFGILYAISSN
jgi:hypothetical protein